MTMFQLAIMAPLLAFIFIFIFGRNAGERANAAMSVLAAFILFAVSSVLFLRQEFSQLTQASSIEAEAVSSWLSASNLNFQIGFRVDALSLLVLSILGLLAFSTLLFAMFAMRGVPNYSRFFSFASLLVFALCFAASADNFIQLLFASQLASLTGYLLIGFWIRSEAAVSAAQRFFIANSLADMLILAFAVWSFSLSGSFDIRPDTVLTSLAANGGSSLEIMSVVLALAIILKCGAFTFQFLLSDTINAPISASSLLHSAFPFILGGLLAIKTMPIILSTGFASQFLILTGSFSAIAAAAMALVQHDMRRIVSLSICSGLGLIVMALGLGMVEAAILLWVSFGFGGALLFKCVDVIGKELGDEYNVFTIGGLRRRLPRTTALMILGIAFIGVIGLPFWSFGGTSFVAATSLTNSMGTETPFPAWVMFVAQLFMGFSLWRIAVLLLFGKPKAPADVLSHVHELYGPAVFSLYLLAVGLVLSGTVFGDRISTIAGQFAGIGEQASNPTKISGFVSLFLIANFGAAFSAYYFTIFRPRAASSLAQEHDVLNRFLSNEMNFRQFWLFICAEGPKRLGAFIDIKGEKRFLGQYGSVGIARLIKSLADRINALQASTPKSFLIIVFACLFVVILYLASQGA